MGWRTAPTVVKLIFLYWLIPVALLVVATVYVMFPLLWSEVGGLWKVPLAILEAQYVEMPISTSIDILLLFLSIIGAFYGWRLLLGSYIARNILEVFAWIFVVASLGFFVLPNLELYELGIEQPNYSYPLWVNVLSVSALALNIFVVMALRSTSVRNYTRVF